MDNKSWMKMIGNNDEYWADNVDSIPSVIHDEYNRLRCLAKENDLFGVLLKCKDVYEIVLKIPTIMALIVIKHDKDNDGIDTEEVQDAYKKIVCSAISSPLEIGKWYVLAQSIYKYSKYFKSVPSSIVKILDNTMDLFDKRIGNTANIKHWRNVEIGHGSLRFKEDDNYKREIADILKNIKKYFDVDINGLYDKCFFEYNNTKLIGHNYFKGPDDVLLKINGQSYRVNEYINEYESTYHIFDSFYGNKNEMKYKMLFSGIEKTAHSDYFSGMYRTYVLNDLSNNTVKSDYYSKEDDRALECLRMPVDYIEPTGIINKIKEAIEEADKGIILLSMERGMGKTALANRLNGLYHNSKLIKHSFIRSYHISDSALRDVNDFLNNVNSSFKNGVYDEDILRDGSRTLPRLGSDSADPANDMAQFLNDYHDIRGEVYTILVIDGIDELSEQNEKILSYIPKSDKLKDGVFVILLSRFANEVTVTGNSKGFIRRIEDISDKTIEIHREDVDNILVLKKYIKKNTENPKDDYIDYLIKLSDYRILYLKAYVLISKYNSVDSKDEDSFIKGYFDLVLSFYGERLRQKLIKLCVSIAFFPMLSLDEYVKYLDLQEITYEFVGLLNDVMPLLSVYRKEGETRYKFADEAFESYIMNTYSGKVYKLIEGFFDEINNQDERSNSDLIFESEKIIHIWHYLNDSKQGLELFYKNGECISSIFTSLNIENDYEYYLYNNLKGCLGEALLVGIEKRDNPVILEWLFDINTRVNKGDSCFIWIEQELDDQVFDYIRDHFTEKDDISMWIWAFHDPGRLGDNLNLLAHNNDLVSHVIEYFEEHYLWKDILKEFLAVVMESNIAPELKEQVKNKEYKKRRYWDGLDYDKDNIVDKHSCQEIYDCWNQNIDNFYEIKDEIDVQDSDKIYRFTYDGIITLQTIYGESWGEKYKDELVRVKEICEKSDRERKLFYIDIYYMMLIFYIKYLGEQEDYGGMLKYFMELFSYADYYLYLKDLVGDDCVLKVIDDMKQKRIPIFCYSYPMHIFLDYISRINMTEKINNLIVCLEENIEYLWNLPSDICSSMSEDTYDRYMNNLTVNARGYLNYRKKVNHVTEFDEIYKEKIKCYYLNRFKKLSSDINKFTDFSGIKKCIRDINSMWIELYGYDNNAAEVKCDELINQIKENEYDDIYVISKIENLDMWKLGDEVRLH